MTIIKHNEELSSELVNQLLENTEYASDIVEESDVLLACVGDELFGLNESIEQFNEGLFLQLYELSDTLFESVKDEPDVITSVEIDDTVYKLSEEVFKDDKGNVYVALLEDVDEQEDEPHILEINGKDYVLEESADDSEYVVYLSGDEEGGYEIVDSEEDADVVAYLNSVDEE